MKEIIENSIIVNATIVCIDCLSDESSCACPWCDKCEHYARFCACLCYSCKIEKAACGCYRFDLGLGWILAVDEDAARQRQQARLVEEYDENRDMEKIDNDK